MVVTFTKIKYEDIPEIAQKAIVSHTDKQVTVDDTGLSAEQQQKVRDYFIQEGYKQV